MAKQMTVTALDAACGNIETHCALGSNSFRRSSAYIDYVALEIACFAEPETLAYITRRFRKLCEAYGWTGCHISNARGNSVCITLQQSDTLRSDNARMPFN